MLEKILLYLGLRYIKVIVDNNSKSKIKVDTTALKEASNELSQIAVDMDNVGKRIVGLAGQMSETWDGKASDEFVARVLRQKVNVDKSIEILKEFSKYGRETASKFDEVDNLSHTHGGGGRSL